MGILISKSRFKAQALEILRRVETTGEPVIVTDNGTPRLIVGKYVEKVPDVRGRLKGSVLRYDDPFAPVGDGDWAVPPGSGRPDDRRAGSRTERPARDRG